MENNLLPIVDIITSSLEKLNIITFNPSNIRTLLRLEDPKNSIF